MTAQTGTPADGRDEQGSSWWERRFVVRYRSLLRYALLQRRRLALLLALTAASAAFAALLPLPLKLLVDSGIGDEPAPEVMSWLLGTVGLEAGAREVVLAAALAGFLLTVGSTALEGWTSWLRETTGLRMSQHVATDVFDRLQRLSLLYHSGRPTGDSLTRLTSDSYAVYTATNALVVSPLLHTLTIVAVAVSAWQLDARLTVVALATAPILALVSRRYAARLARQARRSRAARAALVSFVTQMLHALPVVQAFSAEERTVRTMMVRAKEFVDSVRSAALAEVLVGSAGGLVTAIGAGVVLVVGGHAVIEGRMTVGTLLVFVAYMRTLEVQALGLLRVQTQLRNAEAGLERVAEVLGSEDEVPEPAHPRRLPPAAAGSALAWEGVWFGYASGQPVLRGIDLRIEAGHTVALVGPTGAGKSTLVGLVPRFFDPWSGRVLIDGVDVRHAALRDVRDRVAIVRQEPLLLPLTIAENIAYARPDASRARIERAARDAVADEFIERLPDGYDTVVGERGATLSGGQRQRLAIARALLKDAPILVLDEPTSALDADSEALLVAALAHAAADRTVLVIAHRLSTVTSADRIVVLDDGWIVEDGTHARLLASGGTYARYHQHLTGTAR
jgi:ATP-binding cassette, subfamily B, bacterial